MKAFILRVSGPKGRYWLAVNEDGSVMVKGKASKQTTLNHLAEKAGQTVTRITRFKGFFQESTAAMTVADIKRGDYA